MENFSTRFHSHREGVNAARTHNALSEGVISACQKLGKLSLGKDVQLRTARPTPSLHVNVLRLQIACTAAQGVRKRRSALNELRLC